MALVVTAVRPLPETLKRVADTGIVDRQSGEGRHAIDGRHAQRATQGRTAGVVSSATVTVPLKEVSTVPELFLTTTVTPKLVPAWMLPGGCAVMPKNGAE